MSEQLRRLVIEFGRDGIQTRVLYRSKDAPNPGTVRPGDVRPSSSHERT
jgi:hypothetical protein